MAQKSQKPKFLQANIPPELHDFMLADKRQRETAENADISMSQHVRDIVEAYAKDKGWQAPLDFAGIDLGELNRRAKDNPALAQPLQQIKEVLLALAQGGKKLALCWY
jgi:hypothetical protein